MRRSQLLLQDLDVFLDPASGVVANGTVSACLIHTAGSCAGFFMLLSVVTQSRGTPVRTTTTGTPVLRRCRPCEFGCGGRAYMVDHPLAVRWHCSSCAMYNCDDVSQPDDSVVIPAALDETWASSVTLVRPLAMDVVHIMFGNTVVVVLPAQVALAIRDGCATNGVTSETGVAWATLVWVAHHHATWMNKEWDRQWCPVLVPGVSLHSAGVTLAVPVVAPISTPPALWTVTGALSQWTPTLAPTVPIVRRTPCAPPPDAEPHDETLAGRSRVESSGVRDADGKLAPFTAVDAGCTPLGQVRCCV